MPLAKSKRSAKESTEMAPIVFQLPAEFAEKIQGRLGESDEQTGKNIEELKSSFSTLQAALHRSRMESQSNLLQHKNSSGAELAKHKSETDKVVKELEEAFGVIWPRFEALEKSLKTTDKSHGETAKKHAAELAETGTQILDLSKLIEKRYQSALKRINQAKGTTEVRIDNGEVKAVQGEIARLEKLIKEMGKYEYGSSLNVLAAGKVVGFTGVLNFKSGFTVAINGGQIDVSATASGGGLAYLAVVSGTIDNSNKVFTFASTPTIVVVNGASYINGFGVTISGTTATLDNPVGTGGSIYALG